MLYTQRLSSTVGIDRTIVDTKTQIMQTLTEGTKLVDQLNECSLVVVQGLALRALPADHRLR